MPNLNLINSGTGPERDHRRLDQNAAAAYLGVSPNTLNKWRVVGRPHIPFIKVGRRVVYDSRDLDAYLTMHRVTGREGA
jgi:hypothetical protein